MFLCVPHAGAALVSLPNDNVIFPYITSSFDLDKTVFPANSWQTLANEDRTQKGWISITVPLQNLQIASMTANSSSLSFIEEKSDALGECSIPIPGSAWFLGFGLIGLVAIRGSNRSNNSSAKLLPVQ
jgi:hypothetical protein